MINKVNKNEIRKRKHLRVRKKISGTAECPRLCVFRSNTNIYAQIIDDVNGGSFMMPVVPEFVREIVTEGERAGIYVKLIEGMREV